MKNRVIGMMASALYIGSAVAWAQSSEPAKAQGTDASATSTDQPPTAPPDQKSDSSSSPQAVPTVPVAQQPAPAPAAEAGTELESVTVTAQRRLEKAQDVPISITVINQAQISNANMTNSADLALYAPGLSANTRFGPETATFTIRGFTQDLRTTASVGTYFAEVIAPRGQSSQTSGDGAGPGVLFDLENVQVLKGPQGTLFGRNTTGGAVLIVPRKPTDLREGYLELSGGEDGMKRGQGVLNLPLKDSLKVRFGVDWSKRDGVLNNVTRIGADKLGDTNYVSARLSTIYNITDSIENYTILGVINSDTKGFSSRLFACNPNPTSAPLSAVVAGQCQAQLDGQAASGQNGFYDIVNTLPTPISQIKEHRLINTTTWNALDGLTVKNIFAYTHLVTENGSDIFGTQFHETGDSDPSHEFKVGLSIKSPDEPVTSQQTLVEELQLQGEAPTWGLIWQTGAYFEHSSPDGFSGNNSMALISCNIKTIEQPDPSQYSCYDATSGQIGSVLLQHYKTDYRNRAVYGQATYEILKQLSVTGGLRYTWDEASGYGVKTRYTFSGTTEQAPITSTSTPSTSSKAPTGVIELSYKPNDVAMAYVKYTRGYRQGSVVLAADPGIDTFKPEYIKTYEVGAKAAFGGWFPGRFDVALFRNDLTDQQLQGGYVSNGSGTTTAIFNAGKSKVSGGEAEAYFRVLKDLALNLSYSRLNARLLSQENHQPDVAAAGGTLAGATYTPIAVVGDELPFAPKQSYVIGINWQLPLPFEWGGVNVGASDSYFGKQRVAASTSGPNTVIVPFKVLNLNVTWSSIFGSAFDFNVFGANVLNEQYATYFSGTYPVLGFDSRMDGTPRMIGSRLRYNFRGR